MYVFVEKYQYFFFFFFLFIEEDTLSGAMSYHMCFLLADMSSDV